MLGQFHLLKALKYALELLVQSFKFMTLIHIIFIALSLTFIFYPFPKSNANSVSIILGSLLGLTIYFGLSGHIFYSSHGSKKSGFSSLSLGLFDIQLIAAVMISVVIIQLGLFGFFSVYVVTASLFGLGNDPTDLVSVIASSPTSPQSLALLAIIGLILFIFLRLFLSLLPTPHLVAEKGALAPLASFGFVKHKIIKLCLGIIICSLPIAGSLWLSQVKLPVSKDISCFLLMISIWISALLILGLIGSLVRQSRS